MVHLSVLILGSDPVGRTLARRLSRDHPELRVGLMGRPMDDARQDGLRRLPERTWPSPVSADASGPSPDDELWIDSSPFALSGGPDAFRVDPAEGDEPGEPVLARELIVTAPPILDLLEAGLALPGVDSAVTGLVAHASAATTVPSIDLRRLEDQASSPIHGLGFGLKCDERGDTEAPGVHAAGMAAAGPIDRVDLEALSKHLDPAEAPAQDPTDDPEPVQEDLAMPKGFVDTKTKRLGELIDRAVREGPTPENLVPTLEGLAGEIDSYARFRREPRLRRLRWKTLAAMNFVRPFLVDRREIST